MRVFEFKADTIADSFCKKTFVSLQCDTYNLFMMDGNSFKDFDNFIIRELNAEHLLNDINTNVSLKRDLHYFYKIDFKKFVTNNNLDKSAFLDFTKSKDFNELLDFLMVEGGDLAREYLTRYYFFLESEYEFGDIKKYNLVKNIKNALLIIDSRFRFNEYYKYTLMHQMLYFIDRQYQMIKDEVSVSNIHKDQLEMDFFIKSLNLDFISLFQNPEVIPLLIKFLNEKGYINKYGEWIIKSPKKKTEVIGLFIALFEAEIIKEDTLFARKCFTSTFKIDLSPNAIKSGKEVYVIDDTIKHFEPYIERIKNEAFQNLLGDQPAR